LINQHLIGIPEKTGFQFIAAAFTESRVSFP
jgi:hypothetical protein